MRFKKYPSIENSYRTANINAIIQQGFGDGIWCATNKVHGTNYQFKYGGEGEFDITKLRCGKRSGLLNGDGGNFYGSHIVYSTHADRIANIYDYLKSKYTFGEMALYGELFGGTYPHKDVKKVNNATKVQDGIFYCPHNDFYLFDIVLFNGKTAVKFFSTTDVELLGYKFGFLSASVLHRGTLKDMLSLDPIFEDPIYKHFDLPKIESNMSEGFVVRPMETSFFNSGSRIILKHKNPKFSGKAAKKERKVQKPLPPEAEALLVEAITYITENRLRNVLSHGEELTIKDFGKLASLFSADIYEAFMKDNKEAVNNMEKSLFKKVSKQIHNRVVGLIRPNWQNIVDKTF